MNYSMCHGLAGNAEILLEGARAFPASAPRMRKLALEIADEGIEKHGKNGHKWPSGLPAGDTPSLMVGLAGTGYFYLRLSGRKAPSVLLMRREDWLT
jgi:class II lanthipeptide synthase